MIFQPQDGLDGQKMYMVRSQPGFRYNNYINRQSSGDLMLNGFRFDKEDQKLKSWRLGGDLRGGQNFGFDTGIDWPAHMIDLSDKK